MRIAILKLIVLLGVPLTYLSSAWLKLVKKVGVRETEDRIFMRFGMLPVLDHFYQPMINPRRYLKKSLRDDRELPGIDFNTEEQLNLLSKFDYSQELIQFPLERTNNLEYYYNNEFYRSGDAEYLYNIIRFYKPATIIEIGSGNSTLMARNAILKNKQENTDYYCRHICIEPYAKPWLEKIGVELIKSKAEDLDKTMFQKLAANDILFIDSSHIIRPQGDVLFEYLEILPTLKPGVLIHVHDIFTPKDYLDDWIFNKHFLWNEQYLLEAFLTLNSGFKIIGALNFLAHKYKAELSKKCPIFAKDERAEPGAMWMVRK